MTGSQQRGRPQIGKRQLNTAISKAMNRIIEEHEANPRERVEFGKQKQKLWQYALQHALAPSSRRTLSQFRLNKGVNPDEVLAETLRMLNAIKETNKRRRQIGGEKGLFAVTGDLLHYGIQLDKYLTSCGLRRREVEKYRNLIDCLIEKIDEPLLRT